MKQLVNYIQTAFRSFGKSMDDYGTARIKMFESLGK